MLLIAFLRFGPNKAAAPQHMEGRQAWLAAGLADGVLLASGSLVPTEGQGGGGAVLAHGLTRAAFEARLAEDPFVAEGVVEADVQVIDISRADPRLAFLAEGAA
ncbi:YciI family protein [Rhodovulum sp. DZ06]|uniref:YciI family protein n=1 Tax=Rhodovulum sp. DZ06 TaxID=3425126 RepID=UPI003D32FE6E